MGKILMFALAVVLGLLLFGCTTKSSACCTKSAALPKAAGDGSVADAECIAPDGSPISGMQFGNAKTPSISTQIVDLDPARQGVQCFAGNENEAGYCNVTYFKCNAEVAVEGSCNAGSTQVNPNGIAPAEGERAQQESIPICSDDKPNPCVNEDCRVLLCGKPTQTNLPQMSAQDAAKALEEELFTSRNLNEARQVLAAAPYNAQFTDAQWGRTQELQQEEVGEIIIKSTSKKQYKIEKDEEQFKFFLVKEELDQSKIQPFAPASTQSQPAINLYRATCEVKPTDKKTLEEVKKAKGQLWANTFRFGVGSSFSDYEESRYYFPTSDRYCGISREGKDRYMNYKLPLGEDRPCVRQPTIRVFPDLYICPGSNARYATAAACDAACNNACTSARPGWARWICQSTGIAYSYDRPDREACEAACPQACVEAQLVDALPDLYICPGSNARYATRTACEWNCGQVCTASRPGTARWVCTRTGIAYDVNGANLDACLANCHEAPADYTLACSASRVANDYPYANNSFLSEKGNYAISDRELFIGTNCDSEDYGQNDYGGCASGHKANYVINGYGGENRENPVYFWTEPLEGDNKAEGYVTSVKELNAQFYRENFASSEYYEDQLDRGYTDAAGQHQDGTDFECKENTECMSGYCNKASGFGRGVCIHKDTGDEIDCGCYLDRADGEVKCHAVNNDNQRLSYTRSIQEQGPCGDPDYWCNVGNPSQETIASVDFVFNTENDYSKYRTKIRGDLAATSKLIAACEVESGNYQGGYYVLPKTTYSCDGSPYNCGGSREKYSEDGVVTVVAQSDENGHLSIGNCLLNEEEDGVELGQRGWCEPCTYSTIAVQKIGLNGGAYGHGYCPLFSRYPIADDYNAKQVALPSDSEEVLASTRVGEDYAHFERNRYCEEPGSQAKCTASWNERDLQCRPNQQHEYWPALVPNEKYLHDKLNTYLSSGVMPVLDVRDGVDGNGRSIAQSNMAAALAYSDYGGYFNPSMPNVDKTFITSFLKNRGAVTLVIANVEDFTSEDSGFWLPAQGEGCNWDNPPRRGQGQFVWPVYDSREIVPSEANDFWFSGMLVWNGGNACKQSLTKREYYLKKAEIMKTACSNCLIAVALKNRGHYNIDAETGAAYNENDVLDNLFRPTRLQLSRDWENDIETNNIDLAVNEWIEYEQPNNPYSIIVPQERVDAQLEFSRSFVKKYHKPLLTWDFEAHLTPNMERFGADSNRLNAMIDEVFSRQRDLTDAGIIGVVYQNWNGLGGINNQYLGELGYGRGKEFCSLQNASRKVMGFQDTTYYRKVGAVESCECVECSDEEVRAGMCGYENSITATPAGGGANPVSVMCTVGGAEPQSFDRYRTSTHCIVESECVQCSSAPGSVVCSKTSEGSKRNLGRVQINSLTDGTKDIVAALPQGYGCCLSEDVGGTQLLYTYVAYTATTQKNEQDLYHKNANPAFDCGKSPDLRPEFCGQVLDVRNEKVVCSPG